jgi:hypothetical protein
VQVTGLELRKRASAKSAKLDPLPKIKTAFVTDAIEQSWQSSKMQLVSAAGFSANRTT